MTFEKLEDIALVTPGTSPKGDLINSSGLGLPFFQGSKEFNELYPVPERYTEHPVKVANSGDVLISVRAPVGKVNIAREDCSIGRGVMSVRAKKKSEQMFIFYFLKNLQGKWDSLGSTGSVFENLSTVALNNVDLPSGLKREEIGEILFNIDKKIECNNVLSKTLESMAQAIFKSWFIDFDPVKAKMAGEKPAGMDAATAALFPDSMEESELGLIPRGWELKKVEEVLKRITVKGLPKSTVLLNLGRTLVLEQGDSVIAGFIDEDADVEATNDSPAFVFGDHTCRMRLSTMPISIFPNTIVLSSELINTYWAFGATWGLQKFETYRRHWMELAYKVLIVPNTEVANVYGEQVKPMFEIIDSLMVQNRVLSALRDDLLPRLISGELQIPDEMLAS